MRLCIGVCVCVCELVLAVSDSVCKYLGHSVIKNEMMTEMGAKHSPLCNPECADSRLIFFFEFSGKNLNF